VQRLISFTPFGLPLYTSLVVILLLGSLLRRHGRRTPRLAGTLLALIGLALHLWWFSPEILGANPAPAPGAPPITIMNSNLLEGHGDAAQLVAAVRSNHVDLLVTEEITADELARLQAAGLSDLLPYHAGATDAYNNVGGTMVFADQPLTDVHQLPTGFHCYQLKFGSLTMIAAHPVSPEYPSAWFADHKVIREAAVKAHADLIVGDLNATPDHVVLRQLDDAGFHDVSELANEGWQPTYPANHLGFVSWVPPAVDIDHVLVAKTLAGLGTHTVDIDGTDHLSLVAQVALR
jgi:endonuclease/exonuclease/phosphatase (EEP) superfamily protein YafD